MVYGGRGIVTVKLEGLGQTIESFSSFSGRLEKFPDPWLLAAPTLLGYTTWSKFQTVGVFYPYISTCYGKGSSSPGRPHTINRHFARPRDVNFALSPLFAGYQGKTGCSPAWTWRSKDCCAAQRPLEWPVARLGWLMLPWRKGILLQYKWSLLTQTNNEGFLSFFLPFFSHL